MTPIHSSEAAVASLLRQGLDELGLPPQHAAPLAQLCQLLHAWAERMSLTAHRTPEAIARRLVLDTQIRMAEIAARTGFSSAASFSRAFSRAFGEAPARMRFGPGATPR